MTIGFYAEVEVTKSQVFILPPFLIKCSFQAAPTCFEAACSYEDRGSCNLASISRVRDGDCIRCFFSLRRSLAAVDTPSPGIHFAPCSKDGIKGNAVYAESCLPAGDWRSAFSRKRGTGYSVYREHYSGRCSLLRYYLYGDVAKRTLRLGAKGLGTLVSRGIDGEVRTSGRKQMKQSVQGLWRDSCRRSEYFWTARVLLHLPIPRDCSTIHFPVE